MKPTADRIRECLAELGETPSEIARCLASRGITGIMGDGSCCPLKNYLAAQDPIFRDAEIGTHTICFTDTDGVEKEIPLSHAAAGLVERFDLGYFPDLIAKRR